MFNDEHFSIKRKFHSIPAESTVGDVAVLLLKGHAVSILLKNAAYLFTQEDLWLFDNAHDTRIEEYLIGKNNLSSAILPYDETSGLHTWSTKLPATTNRPVVFQDRNGIIAGYCFLADLFNSALREQLRLSSYFSSLAETVTDAITVVDRNGTVICWNTTAEKIYGIPKENILGRRIGEHFDPEALMVLRILDEGRVMRNTYHRPLAGKHVLINASPIIDLEGKIIGGIAAEQDITQWVRLNDELSTAHASRLEGIPNITDPFSLIKGSGEAIGKAIRLAEKVAATENSVLLIGEAGAGKEQLAQAIHYASRSAEQPFLVMNCGAIPMGLLETELFGYQGGAFTGNEVGKAGKLELANNGTLFLDEFHRLPLEIQAKLYHYIRQQSIVRVGGNVPIPVHTRIIAATHLDLTEMVENHSFRADLYYAVNVVSITLPPLRERKEDIPEMIHIFLREFSLQYQKPIPHITPEVMLAFTNYDWPGNVRELRNVIERCVILSEDDQITLDHLPNPLQKEQPQLEMTAFEYQAGKEKILKPRTTHSEELRIIEEALLKTAGNKSSAAKLLGVSRGTLYNKMKEYNLT